MAERRTLEEIARQLNSDVGAQQVAAVYAKALLGATEKAGQTEAVLGDLDSLITDVLDKLPRLNTVLNSALVGAEQKIALLDKAFAGKVSPLLLNFLKVLAQKGRLELLRLIRREAAKIIDQMRGRVRVQVTTAVEVNGEVTGQLDSMLRSMLGVQPVLEVKTQPELIGGIVVRVGDTVYDGSIATRLERIREQMMNRSLHEIQSRRNRFGTAAGD